MRMLNAFLHQICVVAVLPVALAVTGLGVTSISAGAQTQYVVTNDDSLFPLPNGVSFFTQSCHRSRVNNMTLGGSATGSFTDTGMSNGIGLAVQGSYLYASFTDDSTIATFSIQTGRSLMFLNDTPLGRFKGRSGQRHGDERIADGGQLYRWVVAAVVRNGSTALVFEDSQGVIRFVTITGALEGELTRE